MTKTIELSDKTYKKLDNLTKLISAKSIKKHGYSMDQAVSDLMDNLIETADNLEAISTLVAMNEGRK